MKTRMMMATILLIVLSLTLNAREPMKRFGFELRPGISMSTTKLGDADLKTGVGFEGMFEFRVIPSASVYAGWGWNKFGSEESFAGTNMDFEETGYVLGIRYTYPLNESPLSLFARGGGIYNHIEVENAGGDIVEDSGHGWGWQAEVGVDISMGSRWSLRPGLKYQALNRDLEFGSEVHSVDLNYLSLGVSVSRSF
ncbi:MAG: porin family protein [Bacteroidales bacterium]